ALSFSPGMFPAGSSMKRVARIQRAGVEAALEPARAIRRRPVREALRRDAASRHLLQAVVADGRRGAEAFIGVAGVEHLLSRGAVAPHAGEAVGLQLEADRERIALRRIAALLAGDLLADAEQVLHVVSDLVRNHVR